MPERAGPGPADPSSMMWMYHSHWDETADTYAGLAGAIIITDKGGSAVEARVLVGQLQAIARGVCGPKSHSQLGSCHYGPLIRAREDTSVSRCGTGCGTVLRPRGSAGAAVSADDGGSGVVQFHDTARALHRPSLWGWVTASSTRQ